MNRSLYTQRDPAPAVESTATGIRTPALFPLAGLNELGAPDFGWWRNGGPDAGDSTPLERLNGAGARTPPCQHCGYPMLKSEAVCPRCWRRKGLT